MQIAHHAPQLLAREAVRGPEGLVQHQQLRLVNQGAAQRGALLHAARQLPGELAAHPGKADLRQQRLDLGERRLHAPSRKRLRWGCTISSGSRMFSSVLRQGSRLGAWKAMPAILSGPTTFRPPTLMLPPCGRLQPVTSFMRVDLPQPDGPTTAANSPSLIDKSSLSTAGVPICPP
jgi:hypothetical protein